MVCGGVDDVGWQLPFREECRAELAVVGGKFVALGSEEAVQLCDWRQDEAQVVCREALIQSELADAVHETWEVTGLRVVALLTEVFGKEGCDKVVAPPAAADDGWYVLG